MKPKAKAPSSPDSAPTIADLVATIVKEAKLGGEYVQVFLKRFKVEKLIRMLTVADVC